MADAWPQFPLDDAVWISDPGDLIAFEFFLKSRRRTAPVLLLPTGAGLAPKPAEISQITSGRMHLVRLEMTLAPRLSNLLRTGVDRRTALIFWPATDESAPLEKTAVSYLPLTGFLARLTHSLNNHQPAPAPQRTPARPSPTSIPPRKPQPEQNNQPQTENPRALAKPAPSALQSARNSYRAFFDVRGRLIQPALKELSAWLTAKQIVADLSASSSGTTTADDGTRYEWTFTRGTSAKSNAFHFEMNQTSQSNHVTFTTVMTADEKTDGQGSWLFLHVYNDGEVLCGTPRIASSLLKSLTVVDGDRPLRSGPLPVNEKGVDDVLRSLRSRSRRLPIQVLATDDTLGADAVNEIPRQAAKWTRSLAGQAHVVVLDPAATRRFNSLLPDEFHARPWTLRTYRPGIALIGLMEARQQREISTARLADSPEWKIDRLLVGATRAITQQHPLPREVREIQALLARLERAERVERPRTALTSEPPADRPSLPIPRPTPKPPRPVIRPQPPRPAEPTAEPDSERVSADVEPRIHQLQEAILQLFDATELTDEILEEVLTILTEPARHTDTSEELEQQLLNVQNEYNALIEADAERREDFELTEAELLDAQQELQKKERELRFLRQQLVDAGAGEAAYSYLDEDPLMGIDDIFSVLERVSDFQYVVATWDEDEAMDLDEVDNHGTVPRMAWSALTVMERYCRAKDLDGYSKGFHQFVGEHGELLTPKRVAMGESAQTMARWGDERRFRVPTEVDPSGYVHMEAHIKLTQDGINSPRMHFLDDTNGTGKIYVGYLGRHLTNTQTANM